MAATMAYVSRETTETSIEERFTQKYIEDQMYSVIIYGEYVKEVFNPQTLCPKIVKLNDRKQEIRNRQNILCTEYVTAEHLEEKGKAGNKYRMLQFTVTNWATPIATYQKLTREKAEIINHFKQYINNNVCAVFMHDGNIDDACQIYGLHIHLLTQNESTSHLCKNDK